MGFQNLTRQPIWLNVIFKRNHARVYSNYYSFNVLNVLWQSYAMHISSNVSICFGGKTRHDLTRGALTLLDSWFAGARNNALRLAPMKLPISAYKFGSSLNFPPLTLRGSEPPIFLRKGSWSDERIKVGLWWCCSSAVVQLRSLGTLWERTREPMAHKVTFQSLSNSERVRHLCLRL